MNQICCEELKDFIRSMNGLHLIIGEGEISGSVSLYEVENKMLLSIDDGWNYIPKIRFDYCPYCGKKQKYEIYENKK